MIKDPVKTKKHIVNWIKEYAKNAGIETLVVGLSEGINSSLTALLCRETGLNTICITIPCYSSELSLDRINNFTKEHNLKLLTIKLVSEHDSIIRQINLKNKNSSISTSSLHSCLRVSVLNSFALANKGFIVGTLNRSKINLIRSFQKYGCGCADINPIADLFKSEVCELFAYMTDLKIIEENNKSIYVTLNGELSTSAIIANETPVAEKELDISYNEIEWADRQNEITKLQYDKPIITNESDPVKHIAWLGYTGRQREVIAKIHQMEKISKHKYNSHLPICSIRHKNFIK